MAIRAFLFDAGDVLYRKLKRAPAMRIFLAERGCELPSEDAHIKELKAEAFSGRLSEREYYRRLLVYYGLQLETDIAEGIELLSKLQREVEFFDGVSDTLHDLKAAGFKLGVVTNTFNSKDEKYEWFRSIGADDVWDSYANSCDLKIVKPAPGIYLAAIEPLGIDPSEAAFVGHAQKELDGAKALGMITIRFNADVDCTNSDYSIEHFSHLTPLARQLGESDSSWQ